MKPKSTVYGKRNPNKIGKRKHMLEELEREEHSKDEYFYNNDPEWDQEKKHEDEK